MLGDLTPHLFQLAADGTVVHGRTNPRQNTTDQRCVYLKVSADLLARELCEPGFERCGLLGIEGLGREDLRTHESETLVDFSLECLAHFGEKSDAAMVDEHKKEIAGQRGKTKVLCETAYDGALLRCTDRRTAEGVPQIAGFIHHSFDGPQLSGRIGRLQLRTRRHHHVGEGACVTGCDG